MMMIAEMCREINNYFTDYSDMHFGKFEIREGVLTPSLNLVEGQYFRIINSVVNDGVYQYGIDNDKLMNEVFEGAVWCMKVPRSFIELSEKIKKFENENERTTYTSESFGGYSYSKATNSNGVAVGWQEVFASELNRYRKLRAF